MLSDPLVDLGAATVPGFCQALPAPPTGSGLPSRPPFLSSLEIYRVQRAPLAEVYMHAQASAAHPLQDVTYCRPLPATQGLVLSQADASTGSLGVRPEDAAFFNHRQMLQALDQLTEAGSRPDPAGLIKHLHMQLREWLAAQQGAVGIAQAVAVIGRSGDVTLASVGDCRAWHHRARGRWLPSRLTLITEGALSTQHGEARSQRSALGQSRKGPLRLEITSFRLRQGDLLLLGSDGGLPMQAAELRRTLDAYGAERRAGLGNLARLGGSLDARARQAGTYDDDRSLIVLEWLA